MDDETRRQIPVALRTSHFRERNDYHKDGHEHLGKYLGNLTSEYESDLAADQLEFAKEMDRYKREFRRPWPAWSEVLEVVKSLGYRKVAEPCRIVHRRRVTGGT